MLLTKITRYEQNEFSQVINCIGKLFSTEFLGTFMEANLTLTANMKALEDSSTSFTVARLTALSRVLASLSKEEILAIDQQELCKNTPIATWTDRIKSHFEDRLDAFEHFTSTH